MSTGFVMPVPRARFFDSDGAPLSGGLLYAYAAGTTTPLATYADQALAIANANPIVLDASGEAAVFIPDGTLYKFVLHDADDVLIWSADNIEVQADANLTALSATNLTSGTIADARLSAKVPLRDVAEAISGVWAFTNGIKERGRTALVGEWTQVAFSAGNFTGNGAMTWTVGSGNVLTNRYMLVGKTMYYSFCFNATTVAGTPNVALQVPIPGGYVGAYRSELLVRVVNGGVAVTPPGLALVQGGSSVLQFYVDLTAAVNWTAGAAAASVFGTLIFEIQ